MAATRRSRWVPRSVRVCAATVTGLWYQHVPSWTQSRYEDVPLLIDRRGRTMTTETAVDDTSREPAIAHLAVAIVGNGFSGLGTAIRLRQTGEDNFLIFERHADVGGTWRDNSYPG